MTIKTQKKNIVNTGYTFDEKKHLHMLDGKALTGTTTVLGIVSKGDGLIQWSANMASDYVKEHMYDFMELSDGVEVINCDAFEKVVKDAKKAWVQKRDTAGGQGVDIHAEVERLIKTAIKDTYGFIPKDELEKAVNKQIKYFIKWAIDNEVKFLESELHVYSRELWIGGIVDFICVIKGEVYIGDIKTAANIYPTNFWQTSAYQKCVQEMGLHPEIKGFKIIRLGKDVRDSDGKLIREGTFEVGENYSYPDNIEGFKSALVVYRKINLIK